MRASQCAVRMMRFVDGIRIGIGASFAIDLMKQRIYVADSLAEEETYTVAGLLIEMDKDVPSHGQVTSCVIDDSRQINTVC